MKIEDGGYYALKGFQFQLIRSLNLLLDKEHPDDYIELEQIEDIGAKNELIQVKYKETAIYTKSKIKKPVEKLLEESVGNDNQLTLHCYFKETDNFLKDMDIEGEISNDQQYQISLEYLNEILSDVQGVYSPSQKESFIKRFYIIFTDSYKKVIDEVVRKIIEKFGISNDEAALITFNQFISCLINKVVLNNQDSTHLRVCYRRELDEIQKTSNKIIINEYLAQVVGKKEYFEIIKKECRLIGSVDSLEKIFILNLDSDVNNLYHFVENIQKRFYKKSTVRNRFKIDSPAPYVYLNVAKENVQKTQDYLYGNNIRFIDGYPFKNSEFKVENLSQTTTIHSEFTVKFIYDIEELSQINEFYCEKRIKYYNFYNRDKDILETPIVKLSYTTKTAICGTLNL